MYQWIQPIYDNNDNHDDGGDYYGDEKIMIMVKKRYSPYETDRITQNIVAKKWTNIQGAC